MKKKYTVVSLFSGAGGLDMGFYNKGFDILWANDIDKDSCATHKLWSPKTDIVNKNIKEIDLNTIPNSDIIIGGFPCQGFSLAGPRKIDDSRNTLYKFFVDLVEIKQPKMFLAENVKGILTLGNGSIIEAIKEDFSNKGYKVYLKLLNASNYLVPQDRERVIIIGVRNDILEEFEFPEEYDTKVTIKEALKGIKKPKKGETCMDAFSSRFMSRNRKRGWEEQSFTIPAMAKQVPIYSGSPDMIKKGKDSWEFGKGETRRFSYKECAALQTFPKDMMFVGDLNSIYKQIGNAVPVKFAECLAETIKSFLDNT